VTGGLVVLSLACATPRYRFDRLKEKDGVEVRDLEDLIADGKTPGVGLGLHVSKLDYDFKHEHDEYRLGKNDVLNIFVAGHPEMSPQQIASGGLAGPIVEKDGNIYLPVVGALRAEGLTVVDFRAKLRDALARFVVRPDVVVDILRFESQKFYVLGQVQRPGALPVDGDTTLLEALSVAGGVTPIGDLESAYVLRGGKLLPINLADMLLRGDVSRNIYMRHGDVVYVPDNADQKIYVLGEVVRPSVVPIARNRITLAEGIAAAGGPTPAMARRELAILRGGYARPIVYTIDLEEALLHDHEIVLKPGDRVVLAPTGLATSARYMEQIMPFLRGVQAIGIAASGGAGIAGQVSAIQQ
jgi:polysaccharide biosynthesis/export protein